MVRFASLLNGLVLALLLAGPALAVEKVDINKADAATLDRVLVNVGESKAAAIVAHRKEHGPFRSAEQLAEVRGIGLRTVETNRDRIVLGGAKASRAKAPAKARPKPKAATSKKPVRKG